MKNVKIGTVCKLNIENLRSGVQGAIDKVIGIPPFEDMTAQVVEMDDPDLSPFIGVIVNDGVKWYTNSLGYNGLFWVGAQNLSQI